MTDFVLGVVGFGGFEALRIYKCMWGGRPVVPMKHRRFYVWIITAVAVFAGSIAAALGSSHPLESVYLGFSVPTSLKVMFERPENRFHHVTGDNADPVEDIVDETPTFLGYVRQQYLAFR